MAFYKRIYYMDYYEQGTKHTNAGFIKLAQWNRNVSAEGENRTCFQIYVSALQLKDETESEVIIVQDSRVIRLGHVSMSAGKGMAYIRCLENVLHDIDKEGRPEAVLLRVTLGKEQYFECILREAMCIPESKTHPEAVHVPESKTHPEAVHVPESKTHLEAMHVSGAETHLETAEVVDSEPDVQVSNVSGVQATDSHMERDKWQQLCKIYPHIRPFEDEREYLRLELPDMVVLPDLYYRLVENSFLLHGYYNYGHLILARMYKKHRKKLYIGVPGNYYEREKQVAVMFGFESFEPKAEPAAEGDFGYYMIGVDI